MRAWRLKSSATPQFVQQLAQANNKYNIKAPHHRPLRDSQRDSNANSLHWRHNEHDDVSNHQPHDCLAYSTVYSGADQRKHQSSASLAFVPGIHRWPMNSPHKGPVTRIMFPFDDVIMACPCTGVFMWYCNKTNEQEVWLIFGFPGC